MAIKESPQSLNPFKPRNTSYLRASLDGKSALTQHPDGRHYSVYQADEVRPKTEAFQLTRKEIKINLKDEYKFHLKQMSLLDNFKQIKFRCDHCFFKSIIRPRLTNVEEEPIGLEQFGNDLHEISLKIMDQDMDSVIDSKYKSYLTTK